MLNYLSVIHYANGSKDPLSGTRTLSQALIRVQTVLSEQHEFLQLNDAFIISRGLRPLSADSEQDELTGSFSDMNFLRETICHYLGITAFLSDKKARAELAKFGLNVYTYNLHTHLMAELMAIPNFTSFKAALALAACLSLSDQRVQRLLEQTTEEVLAVTTLYAEGENTLEEILELLTN